MVVVLVLVVLVVGWGGLGGWGGGGGGVFLGEVKARPKDIISFSLDYNKQKLSTDKQSVIKPHFTRHAGKAGGFISAEMADFSKKNMQQVDWLLIVQEESSRGN